MSSLFTVGLQHVAVDDMMFMLGKHPSIKSCIVSVFNFTLLGNRYHLSSQL